MVEKKILVEKKFLFLVDFFIILVEKILFVLRL